jgi:hypothetical protein
MSLPSNSSGEDILKSYREFVTKKSNEKHQLLGQTSLPDDRLKHATNLNQEFNSEEIQRDSAGIIFSDPECSKAETSHNIRTPSITNTSESKVDERLLEKEQISSTDMIAFQFMDGPTY